MESRQTPISRLAFPEEIGLESRQHDALLRLVLPLFIFVGNFAFLVGLEKENLAQAFVRVYLCGERSVIADFKRNESLPLRLEGRYVHNDPAARVRRFPETDGQDVTRNAEIFNRPPQRERVWLNEAFRSLELDERAGIKMLRVDDGGIHVGKNAEFVG